MALRNALSPSAVVSMPSMRMEPDAGSTKRKRASTNVDFPAPVRPTIPTCNINVHDRLERYNIHIIRLHCTQVEVRVGPILRLHCIYIEVSVNPRMEPDAGSTKRKRASTNVDLPAPV